MNTQWEEIEKILNDKNCWELLQLNDGASDEELAELETLTGEKLPDTFRSFYKTHNGQDDGFGLVFGLQFLPVKQIISEWKCWVGLIDDGMNEDMKSQPAGFIKKLYINPKWIPFTHDYSGNHLGVDLDPDKKGTPGQVITFGRDDNTKKLRADSFESYINKFIIELKELDWSIEEEDGWEIKHKNFGNKHYHDWY